MRSVCRRLARILIVLALLLLALSAAGPAPPATAQPGSPIVAGPEWVPVDEGWTFGHASLPNTTFLYLEHTLTDLPVPDNLYLMEVATIFPFIDAMGVDGLPELGAADPAADPLWYLRSMQYQGVAHVVLFTVSVTAVPGKGAVEILVTRPDSLATALASAQQGITAYGAPIMLTRIDTSAVLAAAGAQVTTPTAPGAPPTPTAPASGGAAGTQVVPDCDPAQRACTTYAFGGGWVADPDASMTGQGGAFAVEHQVLANTTFQYFETPWVPNHVPDNAALLEGFALAILSQLGQAAPAPVATGTLADGTLWHLYAVAVGPDPYGMLFTADTADPSQHDVTTILTSPAGTFDQALAAVQADIRVNGVSPLAGIDPAQVMTALGGAPVSPPPAGTTPASATTPAAPGSTLDQTATVGSDTIAYGGDWTFDPANSTADIAAFQTSADPRIIFTSGQGADVESGGDVQLAMEILDAPTTLGATNAQQVDSGVLPSGRGYVLYSWERAGATEVALVVVDVTTTPGMLRLQGLFAPPDLFVPSLISVQQSFQINGEAPFAELDAATLATSIGGAETTPAAVSTPTPGSGGLTLPPLGGTAATTPTPATVPTPAATSTGQTLTVAGATITYTDQWVYDTVNSSPDGATYFDAADGSPAFVGYWYYPAQPASGDAATQLESVTTQYVQNLGATDVERLTLEVLSPTSAWALTTGRQSGLPIVVLTYADTAATGQLRIQLLYSQQPADFPAQLANAQDGIQIDGVPAFAGVDPAAAAALLADGASTTPAVGTTPVAGTTRSVADYQARDAPTGCDAIGWVITGPAQAPATQADRDLHGACVGGATYLATCGQADMAGVPYLQCTVEVTVTGAPMTISAQHITLVDGAGAVYPVDSEITTLMTGVFGLPVLPEASVSPGAPVSGTVYIPLPTDAPAPWVLQVAPETIATTGEAPGALVIEGALQPVD